MVLVVIAGSLAVVGRGRRNAGDIAEDDCSLMKGEIARECRTGALGTGRLTCPSKVESTIGLRLVEERWLLEGAPAEAME